MNRRIITPFAVAFILLTAACFNMADEQQGLDDEGIHWLLDYYAHQATNSDASPDNTMPQRLRLLSEKLQKDKKRAANPLLEQIFFVSLPHRMAHPAGVEVCEYIERDVFPASVLLEHKLRKSHNHNGRGNEASALQA